MRLETLGVLTMATMIMVSTAMVVNYTSDGAVKRYNDKGME